MQMQQRAGKSLHVRYVESVRSLDVGEPKSGIAVSTFEGGSGLSSDDGCGLGPLPARSGGLDNIDSGPDAAFYIQLRVI